MRRNGSIPKLLKIAIPAMVIVLAGLWGPQYCLGEGVALLLQQSTPEGGTVTPQIGVHQFDPGTEITLTATPNPGYQFVLWIGDVIDPTSSSTTLHLDSPKIIVAVFEKLEYESLTADELSDQSPEPNIPVEESEDAQQYLRTEGLSQ
jgi:hypothetical protein